MLLQLQKVKAELAELSKNPQGVLLEAIHSAGYAGSLASPLLATDSALKTLDGSILEAFVAVREPCSFIPEVYLHVLLVDAYICFSLI